jgi:hypothetical protein
MVSSAAAWPVRGILVGGEEGDESNRQKGCVPDKGTKCHKALVCIGLLMKEERKEKKQQAIGRRAVLYPAKAAAGPCTCFT